MGRQGGSSLPRFAWLFRSGASQLGVHRLLHSLHPSHSPFSLSLLQPVASLSLSPSSSLSLQHITCKTSRGISDDQGYTCFCTLSTPLLLPTLSLYPSFTQGFGTERARLVVQVKRPRCTRLRHRTCKTSGSSKIAFLRHFPAHEGTSLRSWFQKSAHYPQGI